MVITISVLFSFSTSVFAYNEYEEEDEYFTYSVYGGYGLVSVPNISSALLEAVAFSFSAAFTDDHRTVKDNGSFGPIFVGADYYLSDNFSFGGLCCLEQIRRRWEYSDAGTVTGYADWNWTFISLMGRVNIQYGWDYFKFYHSLMVGGTYVGIGLEDSDDHSQSGSDFIPGAHLALLGIKVGKEFSVFVDIGVGYLGIINFGASFSF